MDRRSFLSRLIVGAAAAPAVVSVLAKAPPPPTIAPAPVPGDLWLGTDGCWYRCDGNGWIRMTLGPRPLRYGVSTGQCVSNIR